jgi:hypothetical protein
MMKRRLLYGLMGVAAFVLLVGAYGGYIYASTPTHLRRPAFQHYHFRTQIIVDSQPVKFSDDKFQQAYDATNCNTDIASHPIHFHDRVDQMTHVHWDGMTGGEFLKYYGWNFIGGDDDSLGFRYDQSLVRPGKIPTLGTLLPARPQGTQFYVYTGDADAHQQKDWQTFLRQDFETFFDKQSTIGQQAAARGPLEQLFPKAVAHDGHTLGQSAKSEQDLTRINNLIGNVVIFVQKDQPADQQVTERFKALVPLGDSTCGG